MSNWIPVTFIISGTLLWLYGVLTALRVNAVPFFYWLKLRIREVKQ